MAAKKKKKSPARRRAPARKTARRRRRGGVQMSMMGGITEIAKGIAGAVIVSKFGPMIPVADNRVKYGILAAGGVFLAMKSRELRAVGLGAGIASGSLLLNEVFPNLLGPSSTMAVGRLTPGTQAAMQAASQRIREGINGVRGRTIMGNGSGGDFPQPVNGMRSKTIMGSGGGGSFSY